MTKRAKWILIAVVVFAVGLPIEWSPGVVWRFMPQQAFIDAIMSAAR